jgi:hypothetical protein
MSEFILDPWSLSSSSPSSYSVAVGFFSGDKRCFAERMILDMAGSDDWRKLDIADQAVDFDTAIIDLRFDNCSDGAARPGACGNVRAQG